ncbi:MAG: ribonuclease E/G, partial [Asticcacaulis sp.]|nr:ribonuclease E/G [Asticcacaulis sp.]
RARFVARAEGEPRRLSEPLRLQERLLARSAALLGEMPVRLGKASEALDDARDAALNPSGPLSNGGFLTIEPTQALIACDIDSSTAGQGMVPGKTFMKACNELAVADLGRRLRLANLGGLIVVDLIGRRHDGKHLTQVLKAGFAAEGPQVITGPIGKFGTLECVRPWGARPWSEGVKPDGAALYRVNQAIRLAGQDRGRVVVIRDRGAVIEVLRPLLAGSIDPLTPMLRLEISDRPEVIAL